MFQLQRQIFLMVVFLLMMPLAAGAKEEMPLVVVKDGISETINCSTVTKGAVTYVPVREISQAVGLPLSWYQETGSVAWAVYRQDVYITPGLDRVFVAGTDVQEIYYPSAPFNAGGKIFVPLRMLELAGVPVGYDMDQGLKTVSPPETLSMKPLLPADLGYLMVKDKIITCLSEKPKLIGTYSTRFNADYKSRTHNLRLAAEAIDGYRILPGGSFSFNQTVGPRLPDRGFQKAIIFVNKEKVEDYGGGICQVSSTLYNAVLAAGLTVLERHQHSLPVTYVPEGQDATVSFGTIDFRFRNSTKAAVIIETAVEGDRLTIQLFREPVLLP